MKANSICSQCLHSLRQAPRAQSTLLVSSSRSTPNSSRFLSITASFNQQPTQQQPKQPPPPPPELSSQPPPSSPTEPSTKQIQAHLRKSMSSPSSSHFNSLAKSLRKSAKSATETYITYGLTESLFKSCSSHVLYTIPESQRTKILTGEGPAKTAQGEDIGQAEPVSKDSVWFREFGLLPTFSTWAQVTYLHMYLLTVRLRAVDSAESFKGYQQYLLEHFSQEAEEKMILLHTLNARSIRNQYLKDLFLQWRGILAAYDEGMVQGDAVLGAAVWRNLFKGDEEVDWSKVALVVGYMRKAVVELQRIPEAPRLGSGVLDGERGIWARSWEAVKKQT